MERKDLYIGKKKQPPNKGVAQHLRASSTGQDAVVFHHLKEKGHSFKKRKLHILESEDNFFTSNTRGAIYVNFE